MSGRGPTMNTSSGPISGNSTGPLTVLRSLQRASLLARCITSAILALIEGKAPAAPDGASIRDAALHGHLATHPSRGAWPNVPCGKTPRFILKFLRQLIAGPA